MLKDKFLVFTSGISMVIGSLAYYIIVIRQSFFRVYGHYGNNYDALVNYYYGIGVFYLLYSIFVVSFYYFHKGKSTFWKLTLMYFITPTLIPMVAWFFNACLKESIYRKACLGETMYDFMIRILISFVGSYSFIFVIFSVGSGFIIWVGRIIYRSRKLKQNANQ